MDPSFSRRQLLAAGLLLPLFATGCATVGDLGRTSVEDAIRRMLTLSSQRAFARLLGENGFYADEVARLPIPRAAGPAGAVVAALLRAPSVQRRLLLVLNEAAGEAAERAAPVIYDSIRTMTIADARALLRGGPSAATDFLQRTSGTAIIDAMLPGAGEALRLLDNGIVNQVVSAAAGFDFAALQHHVATEAANGIYRAIAREEAAIRADPVRNGDAGIAAVLAGAR